MKNTLVEAPICFEVLPSSEDLKKNLLKTFPVSDPVINIEQNGNFYTVNIIALLPKKLKTLEQPKVPGAFAAGSLETIFISYEPDLVELNTGISTKPIMVRQFNILYDRDSKKNNLYHISFTYELKDKTQKSQAIYVTTQQTPEELAGPGRGTIGGVVRPDGILSESV